MARCLELPLAQSATGGGRSRALGYNVAPPATAATKSIWPHLKDPDIEAAAQKPQPTLSEARKSRLSQPRESD